MIFNSIFILKQKLERLYTILFISLIYVFYFHKILFLKNYKNSSILLMCQY